MPGGVLKNTTIMEGDNKLLTKSLGPNNTNIVRSYEPTSMKLVELKQNDTLSGQLPLIRDNYLTSLYLVFQNQQKTIHLPLEEKIYIYERNRRYSTMIGAATLGNASDSQPYSVPCTRSDKN
ncbi:hypothetical protein NQ317_006107 [Molorchus minor]|uniref:Uncharacterized protein n=1 Tax=Molorchus minor TaxID=1323400 RepID=A0ABQ9IRH3_9CUCU|nr:hypothetical protein NQ317_006107 [Molorchus minor]